MIVRETTKEDYDEMVRIAGKHSYPFPDFAQMVGLLVVVDNNQIVSFGYLMKFVEAVFMPDLSLSKRKIAEALTLLNDEAIKNAKLIGVTQLHGSVQSPVFERLLHKHLGYLPREGAIYKDIE